MNKQYFNLEEAVAILQNYIKQYHSMRDWATSNGVLVEVVYKMFRLKQKQIPLSVANAIGLRKVFLYQKIDDENVIISNDDIVKIIHSDISGTTIKDWSISKKLDETCISLILRGKRPVSELHSLAVGYRRVIFYERLKSTPSLNPSRYYSNKNKLG